ncbi:hypothetical protein E2562_015613 [Oryza meyeriana var. granulata]|uniref:Uncharacterized protein n=1 Tax=Oryza meyeriana var. granulata TaxID=110450 RepID=A0A6G1EKD1_9ORYZ|nr:hypothetical protein E2562_015613 [Oryza meyeriana var. granulata]
MALSIIALFRQARDRLLSPSAPDIAIKLMGPNRSQNNRFSLPTGNELAALIVPGFHHGISYREVDDPPGARTELTEMLTDIKDGHAFGVVRAFVHTVEF